MIWFLNSFHLEQTLEIFSICFKDDPYYAEAYHGNEEYMRNDFREVVEWTLKQGISKGEFIDGRLVGIALLFPVNSLSSYMYKEFFGNPEEESIFRKKLNGRKNLTFMFLFGVLPEFQGLGIGTGLFDSILHYPNLVGDVSSEKSISMCVKRGFKIEQVGVNFMNGRPVPYYWAERI